MPRRLITFDEHREATGLIARLVAERAEADWPTPPKKDSIQGIEARLRELGVNPGRTTYGSRRRERAERKPEPA